MCCSLLIGSGSSLNTFATFGTATGVVNTSFGGGVGGAGDCGGRWRKYSSSSPSSLAGGEGGSDPTPMPALLIPLAVVDVGGGEGRWPVVVVVVAVDWIAVPDAAEASRLAW
jgi:hypothetical protein